MNYKNGKFIIEPFSEGLLYGLGVFETILIENKEGEYLEEHYARLVEGTKALGINYDMSYTSFTKHISKFIERNPKERYALRVNVMKKSYTYDFMINSRDINYKSEDYERGFRLKVGDLLKNPSSPLTFIKSICYADNLLSLKDARSKGFDEVLHLNFLGEVCEGAISNIFFVKDKIVKTPSIECGLLSGIMRTKVIERLKGLGIEVEEGRYLLPELLEADEVFITNSLMRVMSVSEVEGRSKEGRTIYHILNKN